MPLVAYAKEDVWVEPGAEAAIPIYFPGRSVFSEEAYFRTTDNGHGVWHASGGPGRSRHEIGYDVAPIQEYPGLEQDITGCLIHGLHSCRGEILGDSARPAMMVQNPQHTVAKEVCSQSIYTTQEIHIRCPTGNMQRNPSAQNPQQRVGKS